MNGIYKLNPKTRTLELVIDEDKEFAPHDRLHFEDLTPDEIKVFIITNGK